MGPPVELASRNAWKFCGWIPWFMVDIAASDAADWAYYCPLCSRRIKGQTEFFLAQHIWACHAKSKEAGEMSRRFKAGGLGNLCPARVECGAGRGRSLPATARSVERGASVRSQRSVRSELHQKEDRWKEPEQQHERKRKHREDRPRRSRKPARDDDKTQKKGVIMVCEPTYNWKIMWPVCWWFKWHWIMGFNHRTHGTIVDRADTYW